MKTAVEWLIDMLVTENEITLKGENYKLFDQAQAMEKEQIINAYYYDPNCDKIKDDGEQYYNEIFKTN